MQNEWTALIIHERRSDKFKCTSALNKLRIREEWAFLATSVGKTHWRDFVSSKITNPLTKY